MSRLRTGFSGVLEQKVQRPDAVLLSALRVGEIGSLSGGRFSLPNTNNFSENQIPTRSHCEWLLHPKGPVGYMKRVNQTL